MAWSTVKCRTKPIGTPYVHFLRARQLNNAKDWILLTASTWKMMHTSSKSMFRSPRLRYRCCLRNWIAIQLFWNQGQCTHISVKKRTINHTYFFNKFPRKKMAESMMIEFYHGSDLLANPSKQHFSGQKRGPPLDSRWRAQQKTAKSSRTHAEIHSIDSLYWCSTQNTRLWNKYKIGAYLLGLALYKSDRQTFFFITRREISRFILRWMSASALAMIMISCDKIFYPTFFRDFWPDENTIALLWSGERRRNAKAWDMPSLCSAMLLWTVRLQFGFIFGGGQAESESNPNKSESESESESWGWRESESESESWVFCGGGAEPKGPSHGWGCWISLLRNGGLIGNGILEGIS